MDAFLALLLALSNLFFTNRYKEQRQVKWAKCMTEQKGIVRIDARSDLICQ